MLIRLQDLAVKYQLAITGILHAGAHQSEEREVYRAVGASNVYWVEAQQELVDYCKSHFQVKIFQGVIDEDDGYVVPFHITNNGQSSSMLALGTHAKNHPDVRVVGITTLETTRLDTLMEREGIPMNQINFINLNIQGVELRALKSMEKHLEHVRYIYTKVNSEQVYRGCDEIGDMDAYLLRFGFHRVETKFWGNCGWGDAFYIKQ